MYSFGVVLLELITGRRAIDYKRIGEEKKLLEWVRPQLKDPKKIFRIMDIKLEGRYSRKQAYLVASLALQCCNPDAKYRPQMADVLSILEKIPSSRSDHHHGTSSSKAKINGPGPNNDAYGGHYTASPVQWAPQGSPLMPRS